MLEQKLKSAFKIALERAGTQKELEKKTGVLQGNITNFLSGKRKLMNMTVATMEKLFPDMQIYFFKEDMPQTSLTELSPVSQQVIKIVMKLTPDDQAQLLASLAAHYPNHVPSIFKK